MARCPAEVPSIHQVLESQEFAWAYLLSQAITKLRAVLEAAGSGLDLTLKVTVYVSDSALWGRVNAVYAEAFGSHRPARTVVPTRDLHDGALVEIDAIAALRDVSETR